MRWRRDPSNIKRKTLATIREQRGAASVWIIMMLPGVIFFLGVIWDAGNMLALQRRADNMAGASARAGAQMVDFESIYSHTGTINDGRAAVNEDAARDRATLIAEAGEADGTSVEVVSSSASGVRDAVRVQVQLDYEPTFLGLLGFDTVSVTGEASARVRSAITRESFNNTDYSRE